MSAASARRQARCQQRHNRVTLKQGAATAATECRVPTRGRPRQLRCHRGVARGVAAVVDNDGGADLRAAMLAFAKQDEADALAAWDAISPSGRSYFLKLHFPPRGGWTHNTFPPRPYVGGHLCEHDGHVKPVYEKALSCLQELADRLTDALRAGTWCMSYMPSPPRPGTKPTAVDTAEWRDLRVQIDKQTLRPVVRPLPPYGPAAWLTRYGQLPRSAHFQKALHEEGIAQTDFLTKRNSRPAPKSFTASKEAEALQALLLMLEADGLTPENRWQMGWKEWESRVRKNFPQMSGEAWRRIKREAGKKYPELRNSGRKRAN